MLVGIIFTVLMALPLVLDLRRRKKQSVRLLHTLRGVAQEHQCRVHQHGICTDLAIGLDEDRNFLFYFSPRKGAAVSGHVDLSKIRSCRTVKTKRSANADAQLERVELSFLPKNGSTKASGLLLYDTSFGFAVNGEEQFADTWSQRINARLN